MRRKPGELIRIEQTILVAAMNLSTRGEAEFHGFGIALEIRDRKGARLLTGHGTLYRALARLEKMGYLKSSWEDPQIAEAQGRPRRKLYRLTASGVAVSSELAATAESSNTTLGVAFRMIDILIRILLYLGERLVEALLRKYSLPVVLSLVNTWIRFYTRFAPEDESEDRREEMRFDLYMHVQHLAARGYCEPAIACHILGRVIAGAKDDVAWVAPYAPGTIADSLDRSSSCLESLGAPKQVTNFLASMIFLTSGIVITSSDNLWMELLALPISTVVLGLIVLYAQQPRARRFLKWGEYALNAFVVIGSLTAVFVMSWTVIQYRLYEHSLFYQIPAAALPITLGTILATREYRSRLFRGALASGFSLAGV